MKVTFRIPDKTKEFDVYLENVRFVVNIVSPELHDNYAMVFVTDELGIDRCKVIKCKGAFMDFVWHAYSDGVKYRMTFKEDMTSYNVTIETV